MNLQRKFQRINPFLVLDLNPPPTYAKARETMLPAPRPVKIVEISEEPRICSICHGYLSTSSQYNGNGCTDPSHWQAAGLLKANDYYQMAQLAAKTRAKHQ